MSRHHRLGKGAGAPWSIDLDLGIGANDFLTQPSPPRKRPAGLRALLRYTEAIRRERQQHDGEIRSAVAVQRNLFPGIQPNALGLDYGAMCRPARGVSGDYYDFIRLDSGQLGLVLMDVCGKGMPAALLGACLHAAIRAYAPAAGRNCGNVLAKANRLLFETTSPDKYATVFYCVYNPDAMSLTYSNAGHCPPLIGIDGSCARLESLTAPVGLLPELPSAQRTIPLAPGTRLVIASDGILEARNTGGEEFGDGRLRELVHRWNQARAAEFCRSVLLAVAAFSQYRAPADDMTLIAARVSA